MCDTGSKVCQEGQRLFMCSCWQVWEFLPCWGSSGSPLGWGPPGFLEGFSDPVKIKLAVKKRTFKTHSLTYTHSYIKTQTTWTPPRSNCLQNVWRHVTASSKNVEQTGRCRNAMCSIISLNSYFHESTSRSSSAEAPAATVWCCFASFELNIHTHTKKTRDEADNDPLWVRVCLYKLVTVAPNNSCCYSGSAAAECELSELAA